MHPLTQFDFQPHSATVCHTGPTTYSTSLKILYKCNTWEKQLKHIWANMSDLFIYHKASSYINDLATVIFLSMQWVCVLTYGSLWHSKYCFPHLQWRGLHPNTRYTPRSESSQDGRTFQGPVRSYEANNKISGCMITRDILLSPQITVSLSFLIMTMRKALQDGITTLQICQQGAS